MKNIGLKLFVSMQIATMSLMAEDSIFVKIKSQAEDAKGVLGENELLNGPLGIVVKLFIMLIGLIMLGMGIHEAFIAEDRGGEGKKSKGLMKMIGGGLMAALPSFLTWIGATNV